MQEPYFSYTSDCQCSAWHLIGTQQAFNWIKCLTQGHFKKLDFQNLGFSETKAPVFTASFKFSGYLHIVLSIYYILLNDDVEQIIINQLGPVYHRRSGNTCQSF